MESDPNTASENPLETIQKELDTLKSEYSDLQQQHNDTVYKYERDMDIMKQVHENHIERRNKTIDNTFDGILQTEYNNHILTRRLEKLEEQLSNTVPICSALQPDIIKQYPYHTIGDKCPICVSYNVNCLIGSHDLTAEIQLAKMDADSDNMTTGDNKNNN